MNLKQLIEKGKKENKAFAYLIEIYMKEMRNEDDFDKRSRNEGIIYGIIIGLANADYISNEDGEAIVEDLHKFANECCKNSMRISKI